MVGALRAIRKARATVQQCARRQLERFLIEGQQQAMAVVAAVLPSDGGPRRHITRALGRWRGSTIKGYLHGDERTCKENFRCSKQRLQDLVEKLRHSALDKASERTDLVLRAGARRFQKAHERLDMPDLFQGRRLHVRSRTGRATEGACRRREHRREHPAQVPAPVRPSAHLGSRTSSQSTCQASLSAAKTVRLSRGSLLLAGASPA